ncbi:MAG: N-acetylglucosamine kinase [Candidatus Limnocylindrus sp.]
MTTKRSTAKRSAAKRSAKARSANRRDRGTRAAHPLIVGVDGGNSKTDIILADTSGRLLAWVRVGGSNPQGIGLHPAAALLRSGIDAVLARAKRRGERPAAVALCMAGIDTPRDAKAVRGALAGRGAARLANRLSTRNDSEAGLRVATRDGVGIAIVGGAGVNAIGVNEKGRTARFAALGDISGDFGGGSGLSVAALGAAVRAREGRGPRTSLGRAILRATRFPSLRALLDAVIENRVPNGGIGALGRVLLEESERGDRVAREIETLMIDHAVAFAVAAQRRAPSRRRRIPIVLIGSTILSALPGYRARLYNALSDAIPNAEIRPLREPPALGALLYALDESGVGPTARARAEAALRAAIKKAKPVKV